MKKNVFPIILLIVGLLACSDDDNSPDLPVSPPPPREDGEARFLLNNEPYRVMADVSYKKCNPDNVSVTLTYLDENYVLVGVVLDNIPLKNGKYTLQRSIDPDECTIIYSSVVTYDRPNSLAELFEVLEGEGPNELTITHYDSAAQQLKGNFQVALAKAGQVRISSTGYPDTLRFTKGTFVSNISPPEE
ncbi:MAG: hypothetical protein AAF944_16090 [Bacteroidota bacterium]